MSVRFLHVEVLDTWDPDKERDGVVVTVLNNRRLQVRFEELNQWSRALNRSNGTGFSCPDQPSKRIEDISRIFPLVGDLKRDVLEENKLTVTVREIGENLETEAFGRLFQKAEANSAFFSKLGTAFLFGRFDEHETFRSFGFLDLDQRESLNHFR